MQIIKLATFFSLFLVSMLFISCTEDQIPTNVKNEENKITGIIYNESGEVEEGAVVQLKVANYNPILRSALNYDNVNCRGLSEDPEALEFEVTTDKNGCYSFTDIPAGVYALSAKDASNKKALYKPNVEIKDNDKNKDIGVDTLKGYVEITIHVPNSYVSENSYFYIPGTDIYFHISKAGTMYIQVPVGLISLVFCEDSDLFLETLFLIIKNLLVDDSTVVEPHEISKPELYVYSYDSVNQFSTTDTIIFNAFAYSSEGHPLQYRYLWDDSLWSDWTYESEVINIFPYPGYYTFYVQARCAIDTNIVSDISYPLYVEITDSIVQGTWINPPEFLEVDHFVKVGNYGSYTAANASSNVTTEFEYQFDWGDGTYSEWIDDSLVFSGTDTIYNDSMGWGVVVNGVNMYHLWNTVGQFNVSVRVRSAYDSALVSDWSWHSVLVNVTKDTIVTGLSAPFVWGPAELVENESGMFSFAVDGLDDSMELVCIIDWGDGEYFNWTGIIKDSVVYNLPHTYYNAGYYYVKAMLYNSYDSTLYSEWSDSLRVHVIDSSNLNKLPRPEIPYGDSVISVGEYVIFDAGYYTAPNGDSIEYRFDYGDSMYIEWGNQYNGTHITDSHVWYYPGYYQVRCQVRSLMDTTLVSEWSYPFYVEVVDTTIDDTIIGDTSIVIDTLGDTTFIIDTVYNDTSFIIK